VLFGKKSIFIGIAMVYSNKNGFDFGVIKVIKAKMIVKILYFL